MRSKTDKSLVHKSHTYAAIKEAKMRDKCSLKQSIQENRQDLVISTIEHGLRHKIPFADCIRALNIDPQDPALPELENRYASYNQRLTKTPIKKLIAKTFSPKNNDENVAPCKSPTPQVLKDYNRRVKPLVSRPSNNPITTVAWVNQITKGLDPRAIDGDFFQKGGHQIQNYYRDLFAQADLGELNRFQKLCKVPIDLLEIERLLTGLKPQKMTEVNHHPGYLALLSAYRTLFLHAQEHQIHLPRNRLRLNDELTYFNFIISNHNPPADPHLPVFKAITHKLKDAYETELDQEMKIIHQIASLDFGAIVRKLSNPVVVERHVSQLNTLLKEQKKHTFARFLLLPYLYNSFCNTAHAIAKHLSQKQPASGARYIELMQHLIAFQSKPTDQTDQGYRSPHFMDLRINPKETFERYMKGINVTLKVISDLHNPVALIERAHTLPFPGAFSWGQEKILSLLEPDEKLSEQDAAVNLFHCPADLFFALKRRKISQKDLESRIIEHLDQKATELPSAPSILHYALLFTHIFYLRLFSETELLPDVINHQLDNLSEWVGNPFKFTYKEALGECLVHLLQHTQENDGIEEEEVVRALNAHYTGPIVLRTKEALAKHQTNSPFDRFMRIAIAQIHQSLLQILIDPDQTQEVEKTWSIITPLRV